MLILAPTQTIARAVKQARTTCQNLQGILQGFLWPYQNAQILSPGCLCVCRL